MFLAAVVDARTGDVLVEVGFSDNGDGTLSGNRFALSPTLPHGGGGRLLSGLPVQTTFDGVQAAFGFQVV
ncbi:Uncharacterised protein [Mycobacteroides abscessus subsp. massiliense]|nr:Uncharacterised protein [Mycobacteroides abscessus subsp. massiliense]